MIEQFDTTLTELYKRQEKDISYEKFIKDLEKQSFIFLRDLLNIDLELPTRFGTLHSTTHPLPTVKEEGREGGSIIANFNSWVILNKRRNKVRNVIRTKISCSVLFDMTLKEFIQLVGHEMIHYYDLVSNKKWPLYHKRKFLRIMNKWNKQLKPYNLKINSIGCNTVGKIKWESNNEDLKSL